MDYLPIVQGDQQGVWAVPFVFGAMLIDRTALSVVRAGISHPQQRHSKARSFSPQKTNNFYSLSLQGLFRCLVNVAVTRAGRL